MFATEDVARLVRFIAIRAISGTVAAAFFIYRPKSKNQIANVNRYLEQPWDCFTSKSYWSQMISSSLGHTDRSVDTGHFTGTLFTVPLEEMLQIQWSILQVLIINCLIIIYMYNCIHYQMGSPFQGFTSASQNDLSESI
jgi:hypothetical protein